MPAASSGADGASLRERVKGAVNHLGQALEIVDGIEECTVAGAKIQEAIDVLQDRLDQDETADS
jgi:hypothetical protein